MGTRNAARTSSKVKRQERLRRLRQSLADRGKTASDATGASCQSPGVPVSQELSAACSPSSASGNSPEETSTIKQVAAAALILGQNVTKTAEALGVDRRTVQRWSTFDPEFQEAMKATKLEVVITSRQSLLALAESAVEKVEGKLSTEQSPRVALALLRGMSILGSQPLIPPALAESDEENEKRAQSATFGTDNKNENENEKCAQSATLGTEREQPANETDEICEWSDLLPEQKRAITGLFMGKPLAEVAHFSSTSEDMIRGWLCTDRRFFTLLSALQFDRLTRLKYRLLKLTQDAVDIVRRAIDADDARVALTLLRGLGLMK